MDAPASIRVRSARAADVPAILAIYNEAILHTTTTYDEAPQTLTQREAWFAQHQRDNYPVLVAENSAEQVIGWSSLSAYHAKPGYRFTAENSIFIEASHRGQGIGKLLLAPLLEAAPARELHAIIAVIDAANEPSLRLHARFNFREVGRFPQIGFKFGRWRDVVYLERLV